MSQPLHPSSPRPAEADVTRKGPDAGARIAHHDLCFGCGLANLFGLQLELEPDADGGLAGRFFAKQDHQGPGGLVHPGVIATALEETMSLAINREGPALAERLEIDLCGSVSSGIYLYVSARIVRQEGPTRWAAGELRREDGEPVAAGRARFREAVADQRADEERTGR